MDGSNEGKDKDSHTEAQDPTEPVEPKEDNKDAECQEEGKSSHYRRDNGQAMHLQDNMRILNKEQSETMARIKRLDEKIENRKRESESSTANRESGKNLEKALNAFAKSIRDQEQK